MDFYLDIFSNLFSNRRCEKYLNNNQGLFSFLKYDKNISTSYSQQPFVTQMFYERTVK